MANRQKSIELTQSKGKEENEGKEIISQISEVSDLSSDSHSVSSQEESESSGVLEGIVRRNSNTGNNKNRLIELEKVPFEKHKSLENVGQL